MKYFLLGFSVLVALDGSITDIRFGKVKNGHLLVAFAIWAVSILIYSICRREEFVFPLFSFLLNLILSIVLSVVLYRLDIWAPGDMKLFILIVLIYPFSCYVCRPGNIFPALDFVIFSFAIGYLYLLATSILHKYNNNNPDPAPAGKRKMFSKNSLIRLSTNIGYFAMAGFALNYFIGEFYYANHSLCVLIIAGLVYGLEKSVPKLKKNIGIVLFLLFVVLSFVKGDLYYFLIGLLESILLAAILGQLGNLVESNSYVQVHGEDVKPGMILSFSSVWAMQKCIDPNIPKTTTESRRSRMSVEQAEAVKEWCRITKRDVSVVSMLPFVPMFMCGLIVQIIRFFLVAY